MTKRITKLTYGEPVRLLAGDTGETDRSGPCERVELVAYLVDDPWPICYRCRRHVLLVEDTGEWRHFDGYVE